MMNILCCTALLGVVLNAQAITDPAMAAGTTPLPSKQGFSLFSDSSIVEPKELKVSALTAGQKFVYFRRQVFSPAFLILSAAGAGMQQAVDSAPNYGQGRGSVRQAIRGDGGNHWRRQFVDGCADADCVPPGSTVFSQRFGEQESADLVCGKPRVGDAAGFGAVGV